jgi:uncharacterized protein YbjT (DUF2867 family)
MSKIALVVAWVAYVGNAIRTQVSTEQVIERLEPLKVVGESSDGHINAEGMQDPSRIIATLLLAVNQAAHTALQQSIPQHARSSPLTAMNADATRRELLLGGAAVAALGAATPAFAEESQTVVVAGATGQTGRRVLEKLATKGGLSVVGAVRDVDKAKKTLEEASVTVRGAMVQKVPSVDTSAVTLTQLDVTKNDVPTMADKLKGAQSLIIAVGFVPGNPFKMGEAAKAVDNVGTIALIDAAKAAGISKVVLVSSILTDAGAWGQRDSAGFKVTNAFGGVLDEKLVAEKYLRASGLDYTIVRPGGLKATPPSGKLVVSGENTLNSGEISRDLVADVCIAALFDTGSKNKVVEIYENEEKEATEPPKDKWFYGLKM